MRYDMTHIALDTHKPATPGSGLDAVTLLLRAEGSVALIGAVAGYFVLNGSWYLFALLLLLPDLSILGYRLNGRFGARLYNAAHTYVLPGALALAGWLAGAPTLYAFALIWVAHIGLDRALGYGLKLPSSFSETHLNTAKASGLKIVVPRP